MATKHKAFRILLALVAASLAGGGVLVVAALFWTGLSFLGIGAGPNCGTCISTVPLMQSQNLALFVGGVLAIVMFVAIFFSLYPREP